MILLGLHSINICSLLMGQYECVLLCKISIRRLTRYKLTNAFEEFFKYIHIMFDGLELAKQLLKALKKTLQLHFIYQMSFYFVCKQKLINYHELLIHFEHFYKPSRFRKILLVINVQFISIIIKFLSDAIFSCPSL